MRLPEDLRAKKPPEGYFYLNNLNSLATPDLSAGFPRFARVLIGIYALAAMVCFQKNLLLTKAKSWLT